MPGTKPTDANKPKKVADPHPSTEEHYDQQRRPGGAIDPDASTGPENADKDRTGKTSSTSARRTQSSPEDTGR